MAVFRIEKTRDYTVMSNYHLRDMSLSLKAKGLLSLMLSLPENWDYTMKGLARICKDGIDSISGGIRELEAHGYLIRARVRGANGQLGSIEYTILEQPKAPSPTQEKPIRENPVQANPMLDAPIQENPAQLNKEESSNYPSKTDLSITQGSSPIPSSPPAPGERTGQDGMRKRESYRALILENIEYDVLSQNVQLDKDRLDELVELMVDTVCSNREMIRVAGDDYPAEVVRSRLGTKGALIHPCGRVRSAEGLSPHRELSPRSDMAALPQQGAAPLAPLRGYPCTPTKTVHPPLASVPFLRVLLSYPGGDTHSHLPLEHRHCEPRKRQISRCRSRLPKRRKADKRVGRNDPRLHPQRRCCPCNTQANTTSIIHAAAATVVPFNVHPKIKEITGIEIATTVYPFDLYNHEYGNKCAPNTMAYTIIIFSGTALNTHITINK